MIIKRVLAHVIFLFLVHASLLANQRQYISTNKSHYVIGEQVLFDVYRFDENDILVNEDEGVVVNMDLVAPSGQIMQTKSLIKSIGGRYFFSLADSLQTGIYRLIANSEGACQATKRIHVYALKLEEPKLRNVAKIEHRVNGGALLRNEVNKLAIRVTDNVGLGLKAKGALVNNSDSVIQYLDTDANGIASFEFTPQDSLYQLKFGQQVAILMPGGAKPLLSKMEKGKGILVNSLGAVISELDIDANGKVSFEFTPQDSLYKMRFGQQTTTLMPCKFNQSDGRVELKFSGRSSVKEPFILSVDDEPHGRYDLKIGQDTTIIFSKENMDYGVHKVNVQMIGQEKSFVFLLRPDLSNDVGLAPLALGNNEQGEFAVEDLGDEIDRLNVSVVDRDKTRFADFYQEYYFDQFDLDLQLVEERDFDAYLLFFADQIDWKENETRLSASKSGGVLNYKSEYPFDELSMLNLTTLRVLDVRNESIRGIHDFESVVEGKSQVFPYHFTTYLQPIDLANFEEKVDYTYPALKSSLTLSKKDVQLVQAFDIHRNISLSYQSIEKEPNKLPKPDYAYELDDYEVSNTMVDMINYIIKYVSVVKNSNGIPELSMYRYMSTYKYRGSPLIFLNDMPVYDARTVLNLNPKDFERVEVRNSYQSNGHLGNFSLNGSVSFFLKEGVDNPLDDAYANLPVIESCKNFNKKVTDGEFAPDFRHQLYWNPSLQKTKDSFWVDLKSSDLSTTYDVQVTAFMKNGTVVQNRSELVVK